MSNIVIDTATTTESRTPLPNPRVSAYEGVSIGTRVTEWALKLGLIGSLMYCIPLLLLAFGFRRTYGGEEIVAAVIVLVITMYSGIVLLIASSVFEWIGWTLCLQAPRNEITRLPLKAGVLIGLPIVVGSSLLFVRPDLLLDFLKKAEDAQQAIFYLILLVLTVQFLKIVANSLFLVTMKNIAVQAGSSTIGKQCTDFIGFFLVALVWPFLAFILLRIGQKTTMIPLGVHVTSIALWVTYYVMFGDLVKSVGSQVDSYSADLARAGESTQLP